MTRENKVALVIGFGLILFVGILVSDHLSDARTQEPADLLPPASLTTASAQSDPELIDLQTTARALQREPTNEPPNGHPAVTPTRHRADAQDPRHRPQPRVDAHTLHMPNLQQDQRPTIGLAPDQAASVPLRFHDVRLGESLSSICHRYYGDATLADELAQYNSIADPDLVSAGRRLRIPQAEALIRGEERSRPATSGRSERYTTYTIQPGDSLSEIAQRLLNSARNWQQLYELNRDAISDPDDIQVGTVIKVPLAPEA